MQELFIKNRKDRGVTLIMFLIWQTLTISAIAPPPPPKETQIEGRGLEIKPQEELPESVHVGAEKAAEPTPSLVCPGLGGRGGLLGGWGKDGMTFQISPSLR